MKWSSGTSWIDLGFPNQYGVKETAIVIDPSDNKPIVAFQEAWEDFFAQVSKWHGETIWMNLGYPSIGTLDNQDMNALPGRYISITIDPSDNRPIIILQDGGVGEKANVFKFTL